MAHRELLEAIAERAGLDPPDTARRPAESVLVGVARRLDGPSRAALGSTLPSHLATLVGESAPLRRDQGRTPFLQTVASELDTTPERARFLAQAVLAALADRDAPTAEAVRSQLPDDFAELFAAPGDGPPPDRAATAALPEPTDLTADEVAAALASLPGWTGDVRALERTVDLPPGIGEEFRNRIAREEQAMNHHAVVEDRPDGTVFRVWTHARGVVTDLDVELARRISAIIEES
ncbi:DUF2267 domain-containing protein [Nocardioides aquiterrae]|uniref:DUF2267 domain-containing protein n=1 Tax=Nocardioides aquiterrae TaxID=203799 RepID=UPI0031DFD611